jgi:hypothetical protein
MTAEQIIAALAEMSIADIQLISAQCNQRLNSLPDDHFDIQAMGGMTLQRFCSLVAKYEGKKVQVSIGNIREVVHVIDTITHRGLTALIRTTPDPDKPQSGATSPGV